MTQKPAKGLAAEPWSPAEATRRINQKARDSSFSVALKGHAEEQIIARNLLIGDVLQVLQNGFVFEDPEPAREKGAFRYRVEGKTPNSGGRTVRVVVIPSPTPAVVIVTVMWVDE